ncbi:hypothetical protein OK074_7801 [Actinobacteria bacterium OK074]|nr:hypothetical protein OK074_7801 [Actinobacteria bacterium OK074]
MTVTWRSAVSYAFIVVVLSWVVGVGVDLAWAVAAGSVGDEFSLWVWDPWNAVFVVTAVVTLTLVRRLLGALPTWRVPLVDGAVYLAVLLLRWGIAAWLDGDDAPVDTAFAMATFALLSLQLPSAWVLSVWRSRHLRIVLRGRGTRGLADA